MVRKIAGDEIVMVATPQHVDVEFKWFVFRMVDTRKREVVPGTSMTDTGWGAASQCDQVGGHIERPEDVSEVPAQLRG